MVTFSIIIVVSFSVIIYNYSDLQTKAMELLGCKHTGFWNNLFQQAKNQKVILNTRNKDNKSVWTLPSKATPAVELDLMPTDEAPPY